MKRFLGAVLIVGLVVSLWTTVRADIPVVTIQGTASGAGVSGVIPLTGQNTCSVVTSTISGSPTYTIVPQLSSDYPLGNTWVTATTIGSGSIIANGTNLGAVSTVGITGFRLNITAASGGTVGYVMACSPTGGAGSGGSSGGNVVIVAPTDAAGRVIVTTPVPAAVVSPGAYQGVTITCPSTAPAPVNNVYIGTCDSTGRLNVSTPVPQSTYTTYLQSTAMLVCPSSAPAASNSTYIATCDSNGFQNVLIRSTPSPVPSVFATSIATLGPLAVSASARTIYSGYFTNSGASTIYCNIWNVAAASVTLGTTQALIGNVAVPAGATQPFYAPPTQGVSFGTAVSTLCTTTYQGNTGATSGTVWVQIFGQ